MKDLLAPPEPIRGGSQSRAKVINYRRTRRTVRAIAAATNAASHHHELRRAFCHAVSSRGISTTERTVSREYARTVSHRHRSTYRRRHRSTKTVSPAPRTITLSWRYTVSRRHATATLSRFETAAGVAMVAAGRHPASKTAKNAATRLINALFAPALAIVPKIVFKPFNVPLRKRAQERACRLVHLAGGKPRPPIIL